MYKANKDWGVLECKFLEYGKSVRKISLEACIPDSFQNGFLIIAGQHGDEPETTTLLSSVLRSIKLELLESAIVLAANPDGVIKGTRCNANGVDLNRNFPSKDWSEEPVSYRWDDSSKRDVELSPGPKAGSEPETVALISLVNNLKPRAIISLHAPLACIDDPLESDLGKWLAKESSLPLVSDIGYLTPGSFGSWADEQNIPIITFELPHDSIENHKKNYFELFAKLMIGRV